MCGDKYNILDTQDILTNFQWPFEPQNFLKVKEIEPRRFLKNFLNSGLFEPHFLINSFLIQNIKCNRFLREITAN